MKTPNDAECKTQNYILSFQISRIFSTFVRLYWNVTNILLY
jgi:hypothetical protein